MHIKEKGCILQLYVYQVFGIGICTTVNNAKYLKFATVFVYSYKYYTPSVTISPI